MTFETVGLDAFRDFIVARSPWSGDGVGSLSKALAFFSDNFMELKPLDGDAVFFVMAQNAADFEPDDIGIFFDLGISYSANLLETLIPRYWDSDDLGGNFDHELVLNFGYVVQALVKRNLLPKGFLVSTFIHLGEKLSERNEPHSLKISNRLATLMTAFRDAGVTRCESDDAILEKYWSQHSFGEMWKIFRSLNLDNVSE